MTTRTICDYPDCGKDAVWKIEMTDLGESLWKSTMTISGQSMRRYSMDVCAKHLLHVTFDQDQIAEFEALVARGEKPWEEKA